MKRWLLGNDRVELGITERCGMLDPVRFSTPRGVLEPLHRAPWRQDEGASEIPLLQHLAGDFFCMPFGASDVLPDEGRPHGTTANGDWSLLERTEDRLVLELAKPLAGATVRKTVCLQDGQPVIYQQHDILGGSGTLPLGHHTMLHASEPLNLSFAPWVWGGTPPEPVETPATQGRSLLAYPQTFDDLQQIACADGSSVDLSVFPKLEQSEEILMLIADQSAPLVWSAATAPRAGWVWFALKDARVLRNTVLWMSNGGRDYPPFSGRHRRCLGIEEVTGYFHLGHRASAGNNPLQEHGHPTAVRLEPEGTLTVRYAFGVTPVPPGFKRVQAIETDGDGLLLKGEAGSVHLPFDRRFL